MKHKLSEIMKEQAYFEYFQEGKLFYAIHIPTLHTLTSYRFPIDTSGGDLGTGRFKEKEKALLLMRWFNKSVEEGTLKIDTYDEDTIQASGA